MITVTIDDEDLERTYYEKFAGDESAFVKYLSSQCHVNNLEYEGDLSQYEALYDEGEASGDSGLTHKELWENLFAKYEKN